MKLTDIFKIHLFFRSVFTKLLLISFAAWLAVLFLIISVFLHSKHRQEGPFYKNASLYVNYIIQDIGTPPSKTKALELHNKTGMHISFTNQTSSWSTRSTFPQVEDSHFKNLYGNDSIQFGRSFGRHYLRVTTDDGSYFIEFKGAREEENQHRLSHLFLITMLSCILLFSYFAVKKVLNPLRWLSKGVTEVGGGNLSYRVRVRGGDELTSLSRNFNQMAEDLEKMVESKELLLRDISHELRSPLTRLRLAAQGITDTETRKDIEEDIREMEKMISWILDASKHYPHLFNDSLKTHDLDEILQSALRKHRHKPPGTDYSSPKEKIYCDCDPHSLTTVFSNCIDNALKYSDFQKIPVQIELTHSDSYAIITISDHGTGIADHELDSIFQPFYRIDSSRSRKTGGFGLGLAISKNILDAHGGTISASSKKQSGTTLTLRLPLSKKHI